MPDDFDPFTDKEFALGFLEWDRDNLHQLIIEKRIELIKEGHPMGAEWLDRMKVEISAMIKEEAVAARDQMAQVFDLRLSHGQSFLSETPRAERAPTPPPPAKEPGMEVTPILSCLNSRCS